MAEGILIWQAIIFLSIAFGGKKRSWIAGFWVVWTFLQVFALWLSVIQFGTIWLAWSISEGAAAKRRLQVQRRTDAAKACAPQILDPGRTEVIAGPLPSCGMIVA